MLQPQRTEHDRKRRVSFHTFPVARGADHVVAMVPAAMQCHAMHYYYMTFPLFIDMVKPLVPKKRVMFAMRLFLALPARLHLDMSDIFCFATAWV